MCYFRKHEGDGQTLFLLKSTFFFRAANTHAKIELKVRLRPERGRLVRASGIKGDGGGDLSPSHHMRSSANRTSYRKSEAGEQQRRSTSGSTGAAGTGTGTEETHLLAANNNNHHRTSSYQSTTVRRRSPRTTPSARNSAMDGQHLQQQYGGGQGAAAIPGGDHANQYLAYSEQQQQHQVQHMQHAEQDQYPRDEYTHQSPMDHQYHHQQQYQYDQRQQQQQQQPTQQHEVPPQQHYAAAEGVGGPAHAQPPQPPLMDQEAANAEIMAVRRSALTVFSPLTYTWVSSTVPTTTTTTAQRDPRKPMASMTFLFTALVKTVWRAGFYLIFVSVFISNKKDKKVGAIWLERALFWHHLSDIYFCFASVVPHHSS